MIRKTSLLDAESRRVHGRITPRELPLGCEPLSLRHLPYPFSGFLTLCSDCDAPTLEKFLNVGGVIRARYGLPIADSYFPSWLFRRSLSPTPMREPIPPDRMPSADPGVFLDRNGPWLRAYHQGWFDTVHGWVQRLMIKVSADFSLRRRPTRAARLQHLRTRLWRRLGIDLGALHHRMRFEAPPGWQQIEPPRYLTMTLRMPVAGSAFQLAGLVDGALRFRVDSRDVLEGSLLEPSAFAMDLWPLLGNDPQALKRLEIDVRFDGPPGAFLEVSAPALLSDIRSLIADQRELMERFNVRSSAFSSHGIGVIFGVREFPDARAADLRCLADLPQNAHYCVDLLREHGIDFSNSFTNVYALEPVPIDDLVFPSVDASGEPYYDYHRFAWIPRGASGDADFSFFSIDGQLANHSHSDFIGSQVGGALRALEGRRGWGAVVYTHAGVKSPLGSESEDYSIKGIFNEETHRQLQTLLDRQLNLSGAVPESERIFVAPTAALLRMSQVRREVVHRGHYDAEANEIRIQSWTDAITGRVLPDPSKGGSDLRGIPFYVRDAETARLFIDGRELNALIRNPPDALGRASVAAADLLNARPLIGAVSTAQGRAELQTDGLDFVENFEREDPPQLIARELRLREPRGALELQPVDVELHDFSCVALRFEKPLGRGHWRLDLELSSGLALSAAEVDYPAREAALELPSWHRARPRWVVLPLFRMLEALPPEARQRLVGKLQTLRISLAGGPGDTLRLQRVWLLREHERPLDPEGLIVGGSVGARSEITRVHMRYEGHTYRAEPSAAGIYFFGRRVRPGALVRVEGVAPRGQVVEPRRGSWLEIVSNTVDVDF